MKITDKPVEDIQCILRHLSQQDNIVTLPAGRIISLSESQQSGCLFIHTGTALLRRTDSHKIVGIIEAPALIWTGEYQQVFDSIYADIVVASRVEVMPSERFKEGISRHQLWEPLSTIFMSVLVRYFSCSSHHYDQDTTRLVYRKLQELANGPENIRSTFRPADYIQQRTMLSRSSIMKQLSVLKNQGILNIREGCLYSFNPV